MTVVVKLGSSIVAARRRRAARRRPRRGLRAGRRAGGRRRAGRDGHLRRDRARHASDGAAGAPAGDGRAAGRLRGRPGRPVPRLRGAARRARRAHAAQVLLTASDIAARTNYLNARQTLRRLLEWGVVPVVNENDTTATDEITFGDNDFLAAQVAILLEARLLVLLTDIDGLYTGGPAAGAGRAAGRGGRRTSPSSTGLEIGDRTSPSARAGCAARWRRPRWRAEAGIPAVICNGTAAGTLAAPRAGEPVGTRFAAQGGEGVELQALAQVREADPWPAARRRGRRARPARERLEPAAGRDHRRRGRVRGRRRGRGRQPTGACRQGDRRLLGGRARPGDRA